MGSAGNLSGKALGRLGVLVRGGHCDCFGALRKGMVMVTRKVGEKMKVGDMAYSFGRRTLHVITDVQDNGYSHDSGFLGTETCRKATYQELVQEIERLRAVMMRESA